MDKLERLNKCYAYVRSTGTIHTKKEFAEAIGWAPTHLSSAFKGNESRLTDGLMSSIGTAYPEISKVWLLTGEGEMLNDSAPKSEEDATKEIAGSKMMIPLIHIDSVGGVYSSNSLVSSEQYVERMVPFPDARPGDVAILQSGNSMAPTIPAGAILQIRRVDNWQEYFGYGGDFVLWLTDERRITKQVLKYEPDPKNYVTCHSYNPESADEELPKSMIKEVWKVVNVLINKGW